MGERLSDARSGSSVAGVFAVLTLEASVVLAYAVLTLGPSTMLALSMFVALSALMFAIFLALVTAELRATGSKEGFVWGVLIGIGLSVLLFFAWFGWQIISFMHEGVTY